MFWDRHFKVELFFSWLPCTHTGIILTNGGWCTWGVPRHAWLRCCVWWCTDRSLTAHELGKTTDRVGTKTFLVCAITPWATGLKTLGQFLRLFSLPLLNVKENAGDRKSLNRTLINCSPHFCPGMQTKWMARHDVAGGTCMKLLRKGSALNLARGCLAWIMDLPYWTVLAKTSQRHDNFFLLPYLIGVFLRKSIFSARLQNGTKPFCGYPAVFS